MATPDGGRIDTPLQHATWTAGVLIGGNQSVSPNAQLHATAETIADEGIVRSLNYLATRTTVVPLSGDRMRAINYSGGLSLQGPIETPNGKSYLTSFVDWSASEHDVLYVVSWMHAFDDPSSPSDNYNGMTIAASGFVAEDVGANASVYRKFDVGNHLPTSGFDATGIRTSIDLLAPGTNISVLNHDETSMDFDGGSAATPHVTGAVALLQQYANQQIAANNPAFDSDDSRRHEVMKAVLLNSADKISGVHGSKRTVVNAFEEDWEETEASTFSGIPLDNEIGAGHLNVGRALEQYQGGASGPGTVGDVGWDFRKTGGVGDQFEYVLAESVNANDYIAITLTWDRVVEKTGSTHNFNPGDQFDPSNGSGVDLSDLNLYLVDADAQDLSNPKAVSNSISSSVEHIFFKAPSGGDFKIVVEHNDGSSFSESDGSSSSIDIQQEFSLAWWSYEPSSILFGDYNHDGSIDLLDYDTWVASFGDSVFPGRDADGNLDGIINAADYTVWRDAFAAISLSVPEPSTLVLLLAGAGILGTRKST